MTTPERECITFFPMGKDAEYTQCKAAKANTQMVTSKTPSKVKGFLEKTTDTDLVIVAHGADDTASFYGPSGCVSTPSKTVNEMVVLLKTGLGDAFSTKYIARIFLWVCYGGKNGVGTGFHNAIKDTGIPVFATNAEIGGVGTWNLNNDVNSTKADTFYQMK